MLLFWHADEDRGYWVEMACPTADLLLALHSYPVVMYALVCYGIVWYVGFVAAGCGRMHDSHAC